MKALYHIPTSPFSRRTRLCLAAKGVAVELRDVRASDALRAEARALWAPRTVPVLVDEGAVLGDSTAISRYLDRAYEGPPLWPTGAAEARAAFAVAGLVDGALDRIIDTGTRYHAASGDPAYRSIVEELVAGRAQGCLDALGRLVGSAGPHVAGATWTAADAWLYTMTAWLETLPARAAHQAMIAQVVALPWTLPPALSRWADAHRARADVVGLDATP